MTSLEDRARRGVRLRIGAIALLCGSLAMLCASFVHVFGVDAASSLKPPANPDERCASCHQAIYRSYENTPMAQGSGPALIGYVPGALTHQPSGVRYRVFERGDALWMSFQREASSARGSLNGERKLEYFIGSGRRGRTFLYRDAGLWFELPINFYARTQAWDMAPAYEHATTMPAPLPVEPNCLHCHSTNVATPVPEARNAFPSPPFAQGGIGCNTCHGDPSAHLAQHGHGGIINPAKLPHAQRESACIQCHLEGDAVVFRAGRSLAQFVPGDNLQDFAVYFVRASQASGTRRATSQYEALLRSACKRGSGDRLTCTTCHDPHTTPSAAERVAWFRSRCLSCHTDPAFAKTHHPEQPDCATCHMPTRSTADISHEQLTDHDIERLPRDRSSAAASDEHTLVPVGDFAASDRDLGLAYAQFAQRGDRVAGERALNLLQRAERASQDMADEQLHLNLGFLEQVSGHADQARSEYEKVLKLRPYEPAALSNLGVLDASTGETAAAVALLKRLVTADPSQTTAGLNLAFLLCRLGQPAESRQVSERIRELNPDSPALRQFMSTGEYEGQKCPAFVNDNTSGQSPPASVR